MEDGLVVSSAEDSCSHGGPAPSSAVEEHAGHCGDGTESTIASLAASLRTGTTYLTNPVEHFFGHAAARNISKEHVDKTVHSGWRFLTHESSAEGGKVKPFRWMHLRPVRVEDLAPTRGPVTPTVLCVPWHVVIAEMATTASGQTRVVTHYFMSAMDRITLAIRDAFEWLDEDDDPRVIETVVTNSDFQFLLKLLFELGDTSLESHHHVLAKQFFWPEGTLLHHCCEQGLACCVQLLLERYSPQTAPTSAPWLRLADPMYCERKYHNSAFHSAAWGGHTQVFNALWAWAQKHGQEGRVRTLRNKQRQTALEMIKRRYDDMIKRGLDASMFSECYGAIAKAFGSSDLGERGPPETVPGASTSIPKQPTILFESVANPEFERAVPCPSGICLDGLADALEKAMVQVSAKANRVDRILLLRVEITGGSVEAAGRVFCLLGWCGAVSFMKCRVTPSVMVSVLKGLARLLRDPPYQLNLQRLRLSFTLDMGDVEIGCGSAAVTAALQELIRTYIESTATNPLHSLELPEGMPKPARYLVTLLKMCLKIKSIAASLFNPGRQESDFGLLDHMELNPLLEGPVALERRLMDKTLLCTTDITLMGSLDPNWREVVQWYVESQVQALLTMAHWAPLVAGCKLDAGEPKLELLRKLADEALVVLLRMRSSSVRPGLELAELVRPALLLPGAGAQVPETMAYFSRRWGAVLQAASDRDVN